MPSRQRLHCPQPAWISTVTRCPILYSSTPGPSATTVPIYSWPGVKFLLCGMPPWIERRRAVIDDFEIGGADRDRIDAHQHFGALRHRHRLVLQCELAGIAEHPGFHRIGNGKIPARLHTLRRIHLLLRSCLNFAIRSWSSALAPRPAASLARRARRRARWRPRQLRRACGRDAARSRASPASTR